ncbi:MAG: hypothetical protein LKM45_07665, partial [Wolbachia endosymbiont of Alcedoecus sp.]|nr:hypothetical protein [Wolbachia endosymbiont of Alcedoecus sp.]
SCAGGTYNKLFESLAGLHPSVVITLDEKEASRMVEETITQGFPEMARENLKNFSGKEQEKIRNELPELSPETVRYIITTHSALEKKFKKFSSKPDNNKQKKISETCMNNLPYVELGNPSTERAK